MMNERLLDKLKTVVESGDEEEIRQFLYSEEGEEIRRELEQIVSSEVWEVVKKIVASLYRFMKDNEELILSLIEEEK